jgi:hypothetical protein
MADSGPHYRYRASPKLSANQIAEYLTASPPRRKTIIQSAKFPKTSVVAKYSKARDGLGEFLADNTRSLNRLAQTADFLDKRQNRPGASDWVKQDSRLSLEALDVFQRSYNKLGLPKLACRSVIGPLPSMPVGPMKIGVSIDLTTHRPVMSGKDHVGGLVFLFSKGESSGKNRIERCKIISGLIFVYVTRHLGTLGDADRKLCFALDVLQGVGYQPPGTFAQKMKQVEEACAEIADRWPNIEPPDGYDGPSPD